MKIKVETDPKTGEYFISGINQNHYHVILNVLLEANSCYPDDTWDSRNQRYFANDDFRLALSKENRELLNQLCRYL